MALKLYIAGHNFEDNKVLNANDLAPAGNGLTNYQMAQLRGFSTVATTNPGTLTPGQMCLIDDGKG